LPLPSSAIEFGGFEAGEPLQPRGLTSLRDDAPPETAKVQRGDEAAVFALLAQIGSQRDAVLDHAVMHVHEIQGAFGSGAAR
jgi:hypothetical protein